MADSSTNLDTISTAQSQKEVTANAMDDAESPAAFGARRASTTTGLTWGYYGGKYIAGGASPAITMLANGTLALTASTTNYVEFDPVLGAVSYNATAFTAGRVPLYTVVTGASTVTSYTDQRAWGAPVNPRITVSVAGGSNVTLTQIQAQAEVIEFTGALTANIQVIVPLQPGPFVVFNNTTGAFTLTVIGASGTGVVVGQGKRTWLYRDGTNVVRVAPDTSLGNLASAITAASGAISNSETYVTAAFKIPANTSTPGDAYRIRLYGQGTASAANASTANVRLGTAGTISDTLLLGPSVTSATSGTNVNFEMEFIVTIRSVGSSGTATAAGHLVNGGSAGLFTSANSVLFGSGNSITINTTADLYLGLSFVTAASTTSANFQQAIVEKIA